MPVGTVYNNGTSFGCAPLKNDHKRGIRGETNGWTSTASRSNQRFLYSVVPEQLTGFGYAFTFTVKDLPPTPADWEKLRRKFIERLRRMGFIRLHWLTEWQRRGVPHLHGCVYFEKQLTTEEYLGLSQHWVDAAKDFNASILGQNVKEISSALGWLQYLAKHAARGVWHYQRNGKPKSWEKTGRMWGKSGEWPTRSTQFEINKKEFFRLRRLFRSWRIADARKPEKMEIIGFPELDLTRVNGKRIRSARSMLQHKDIGLCTQLGVSEWIPEEVTMQMLYFIQQNPD